jgi:glycosidase
MAFGRAQSIYQVVTDRFFDGDPSNNDADGNYHPLRERGAHGGDFKGLEQKLDYIKALGATAIWISPVLLNAQGEYHGYAARDFYKVDPRWGTLADLQHMVAAAHARGLLVINDIVVNHGGDLVYSTDPGYGNFRAPPDGYQPQLPRSGPDLCAAL